MARLNSGGQNLVIHPIAPAPRFLLMSNPTYFSLLCLDCVNSPPLYTFLRVAPKTFLSHCERYFCIGYLLDLSLSLDRRRLFHPVSRFRFNHKLLNLCTSNHRIYCLCTSCILVDPDKAAKEPAVKFRG